MIFVFVRGRFDFFTFCSQPAQHVRNSSAAKCQVHHYYRQGGQSSVGTRLSFVSKTKFHSSISNCSCSSSCSSFLPLCLFLFFLFNDFPLFRTVINARTCQATEIPSSWLQLRRIDFVWIFEALRILQLILTFDSGHFQFFDTVRPKRKKIPEELTMNNINFSSFYLINFPFDHVDSLECHWMEFSWMSLVNTNQYEWRFFFYHIISGCGLMIINFFSYYFLKKYSETNCLDTGLLIEVWNKGLIWDKALGHYWLPLHQVPYSNEVNCFDFVSFTCSYSSSWSLNNITWRRKSWNRY